MGANQLIATREI